MTHLERRGHALAVPIDEIPARLRLRFDEFDGQREPVLFRTEASGIGKGVQKSSGKRRGSGNKGGEEGSWRGGPRWVASASEEWRSWESFSSILMSDFNIFLYVCCFVFFHISGVLGAVRKLMGNIWNIQEARTSLESIEKLDNDRKHGNMQNHSNHRKSI